VRLNEGRSFSVVLEMDFPLGESSDLAYDTWAREIRARLNGLGARVHRQGGHLKVCLPLTNVKDAQDIGWATSLLLGRVAAHAPGEVTITVVEGEPAPVIVPETIPNEQWVQMPQ